MSPYRRTAAPPVAATEPGAFSLWPAALAIAIGVTAFVACLARAERTGFEALPPAERALLLERTLENLEMCRRQPAHAMQRFCEEQAELARALPECGGACRERTRPRGRSARASGGP